MPQSSMNRLRFQQLLEEARRLRLVVAGDVMLDEFVWGRVSRISPEAPVPVVEVQSESFFPGGAANVARNLRPFCAGVAICGVVGQDAAAHKLRGLLEEEGIETGLLLEDPARPTIVKTRVIARHQQVVRVDREKAGPCEPSLRARALEILGDALRLAAGLIFEDYGKGFLSQDFVTAAAGLADGKILTADPNPNNPLNWRGIHVLKPNRGELFALAGQRDPGPVAKPLEDEALAEAGRRVLAEHHLPALLATLGEHGMILFQPDAPPYHTPTRAREVFDVSGAGDTSIAIFTLARCAGASLEEAAELANAAAGIVVGKLGTATLTPEELLEALAQGPQP